MVSVALYFLAFAWGFCILFSLVGWGAVLNWLLFRRYHLHWAQKAAWGIALSIAVGGLLNVTSTISRTVILSYLTVGATYCLFHVFRSKHRLRASLSTHVTDLGNDPVLLFVGVLVGFLTLLAYAGAVYSYQFNSHDDYQAYFVFPQEMLQLGALGNQPLSERKITSSLGGAAFLDTFVLSLLSEGHLHLIDYGVGTLIIVGQLFGLFVSKGLSKRTAASVLILFFIVRLRGPNITTNLIGLSMFLSLFSTLDWDALRTVSPTRRSVILALIVSSICTLKSSLIPAAAIFITSSYALRIYRSGLKKEILWESVFALGLTTVFLLPWMWSMYESSGTLLYPLLGQGYHGSAYGTFWSPYSEVTAYQIAYIVVKLLPTQSFLSLCVLGFVVFVPYRARREDEAALALFTSALLATLIMASATSGYGVGRYSYPFAFAAIFVLLATAFKDLRFKEPVRLESYRSVAMAAAVVGCLIGSGTGTNLAKRYQSAVWNIKDALQGEPLIKNATRDEYARMQQSIPQGEPLVTRLEMPFLLNFKRNTVYIVDYPGGASLPPGMPAFKGPEALSHYFISKGIRYIAFSYRTQARFTREKARGRLKPRANPWIREEARHTLDFQENLIELGKTRRRMYDDGKHFILDLLSPVADTTNP